ncbi:DoxX family protein [Nonomuraea sp. CA-218870]|uniref:DoxX family protein n=1 Tax=Nonomuraea sp. CA-218870 TaxID=3239998 RepID=UPI003D94ADBB
MDLALWIVAGLLAAVFGVAGLMKLTQRKETLAASGLAWTEDFSAATVKAIGGLEVLAAFGLILPATFGIAPVLVPLAAAGLVLVMIGAAVTHARRDEYPAIAVNAVLLLLAAFVAWGRFGPHAF